MTVLLNRALREPGGEITDEVCDRLLTAEEGQHLREGIADGPSIRKAMLGRVMPSMIDSAAERCHAGAGRGILFWSRDASVHYIPEPQLSTALRLAAAIRRDIRVLLNRYSPESEAVVLTERRDEVELLHLGQDTADDHGGSVLLRVKLLPVLPHPSDQSASHENRSRARFTKFRRISERLSAR